MQAEPVAGSQAPNERAVKAQLERILASRSFSKSERLSGFLSFVVEETLRGGGDGLKESVLARELYGKGPDFDTAADPAVRIDARRLRDKLREYYSEFGSDPVLVSVPKGRYAPVFEWNPRALGPAVAPVPIRAETESPPGRPIYLRRRFLVAASVCLFGLIITAIWFVQRDPAPAPVPMPLTAYAGSEGPPSLSPDGQFVAFDWTGTAQPAIRHIYIKDVHGEALRQLTDNSASERNPAWSPDGSHIAFVRGRQGVLVISPLGGSEKKVSDTGTHVGWASDSKSVLIRDTPGGVDQPMKPFGIYQVFLETGERRQITQAPAGVGDWVFSVSPDGTTLAFARYGLPGIGDVFVVPMSGGEPRRLTNWATSGISVAWTPDGREIVYSVKEPQGGRLWRIPWNVTTPGRGKPLASQTGDANFLSISRPGANRPARLAYQVEYLDVGLRLVDLTAVSGGILTAVQPLADSTRLETAAGFSRDATMVAFASNRSGTKEIWICNRDGSGLRQLTSLGAANMLPAGWSPDERMFMVQATVNGNTDIYVIPANGGKLKRLTSDPFFHTAPCWSRDGKWIYYSSNRSASSDAKYPSQIWRMPAEGGEAVQITRDGGFSQQESVDGKFLYFLGRPTAGITDKGALMRIPVEGSVPEKVLEGIGPLWSITRVGIFFMTRDGRADTINLYRFEDGRVAPVGSLPFRISAYGGGMAVSQDGRWLLTNQTNRNDTDLMLIDNFR